MRKVEYDYEPEVWEFVEESGKRTDLISKPKRLTNKQFIDFLEKPQPLSEEEAVKLN